MARAFALGSLHYGDKKTADTPLTTNGYLRKIDICSSELRHMYQQGHIDWFKPYNRCVKWCIDRPFHYSDITCWIKAPIITSTLCLTNCSCCQQRNRQSSALLALCDKSHQRSMGSLKNVPEIRELFHFINSSYLRYTTICTTQEVVPWSIPGG